MNVPRCILALAGVLCIAPCTSAQNSTNLWLVDLHWTNGRLVAGRPVKLTHDNGTNSQPSFTPDGRAIVLSAQRDTGRNARSDIYRIDLASGRETQITHTPENENSPTVNARGEYVAVRWQPATLFKEFGPWVYSADGTPLHAVLPGPDTTGYYTPLAHGAYALTRPKSKTFTLGLFDAKTGAIVDVDSGLPALPAQRIPGERALSYVRIDSSDAHHTIRRLDLATKRVTSLGPTLVGRIAHVWIPGRQTILMAKGATLYARRATDTVWRAVATFDDPALQNVSAYAVSPMGDKLVLTSPKRLGLVTVLRDSLEAGKSGAEVSAMVLGWRTEGKLDSLDVSERAISALGDELQRKHRGADAAALHQLAATLFPPGKP